MTTSQKTRFGGDAARKWKATVPGDPLLKRPVAMPQPWPLHPQKGHHLPPQLPLFHTRHAEESAERPHLVTIIRPGDQTTIRKVTVLLNRRGVVSFEQLLLDLSEALGFPQWHRSRITRLFTIYGREVKGVCDFFRGEVAFLALGKSRPDLSSVQEALEELFPDDSHYQTEALKSWEKRLRPSPDKAAKADSGYSEGTDSNQEELQINPKIRNNKNMVNSLQQKLQKKTRKPAHPPNHLQKLRVKSNFIQRPPSVIGPFRHQEPPKEIDLTTPNFCENCLARRAKYPPQEQCNNLSGKVPLPPVVRKPTTKSPSDEKLDSPLASPGRNGEDLLVKSHHNFSNMTPVSTERQCESFASPLSDSKVTMSEIEAWYDIGRVVGDGNFAVVRECRRRDTGQTLALKVIERSKLVGREHMMQNELSLLGSLSHPRIVRLFAHHHTDTHSYLVMEFVSGGDLFEAISEKGKFSEAEAGIMVSDVSEALSYIHCKSIVHRDLKPENLLIERLTDEVCRLKLGDFGLAMVVTEPVFTICGTPTYVAPEILLETGYGVPVDIWALGVLLYILLCGFPPFRSRDRDQEELFHLIKQGQLHFLSPYWDPISEEAKQLVRALLQPDPTLRLTAEQALLHPWVKAMTSICRQGALSADKYKAGEAGEQQLEKRLQKPAADTQGNNEHNSVAVPIYNTELKDRQARVEVDIIQNGQQDLKKNDVQCTVGNPDMQEDDHNKKSIENGCIKLSSKDGLSPASPNKESKDNDTKQLTSPSTNASVDQSTHNASQNSPLDKSDTAADTHPNQN